MALQETKELPNSKESEMMVLGCMMTCLNSLDHVIHTLDENDFYFSEHRIVFQALKHAHKNNKPGDVHIIAEYLTSQNKLETLGGRAYLTHLALSAGTSAYPEEYAEIVKKKSLLRQIIYAAQSIEKSALDDPEDPSEACFEAQNQFKQLEKSNNPKDKFPIKFLNQFEQNPLFIRPPEKPMLLECANEQGTTVGFLPKSIVAMLVGAGGIGKTHMLAQLAIAVTTGTAFLDTYTTTLHCGIGKKGNVFLGLGENQYDDISRIVHKASKKIRHNQTLLEEASNRLAAFSFCGQNAAFIEETKPTRYYRDFKRRLEDMAPDDGWTLIILDPVSRLLGADAEIDNAAATQFIALLEELTIDLPGNPTILFAHHVSKAALKGTSKTDQSASRGSSALTDGVRWQVNLSKKEASAPAPDEACNSDIAVLKMTKSNFTAIHKEIELKKDDTGFIEKSAKANNEKPAISAKVPNKIGNSGNPFINLSCQDN